MCPRFVGKIKLTRSGQNAVGVSKQPYEVEETEIEGLGLARMGQRVRHPKFGRGVIKGLFIFENGTKTVRVNFEGIHRSKSLLPQYALLKPEGRRRPWWQRLLALNGRVR
jgi:hypothetical protein